MKLKISLSNKLFFFIIIGISIIVIPTGVLFFSNVQNNLIDERIDNANSLVNFYKFEIADSLYLRDTQKLHNIANAMLRSNNLENVFIMTPQGTVITDGTDSNIHYNKILNDDFCKTDKKDVLEVYDDKLCVLSTINTDKPIGFLRLDFSLNDINEVLFNYVVFNLSFVVGAIFVAILIWFFANREIVKPIISLEKAVNKIEQGDLNTNVELKGSREIKSLGKSFNEMAIKIKDSKKLVEKQITELKKVDQQKDEFLSVLSHELSTPLTPIKGTCEILLDEDYPENISEKVKMHIQSVASNSTRLYALIDKLLLAQKIDLGKFSYKMENISVKEYLDDIYNSYSRILSQKNIEFVNSIKDTELVTWADKNGLHQVFSNLINNAIEFVSNENGRVEIGADKKDDKIEFFVKDNGIGISTDKHKIIFDKLYQVDYSHSRAHGGLGLGLSICKNLVNNMGGSIWIESEEGKGSTFYFTLKIGEKK